MKTTFAGMIAGFVIAQGILGAVPPANAAVSDWQKGVNMIPSSSTDFGSSSFDQSVRNAAAAGVNYITLNIPLYQSNVNTTDIQTGGSTPTDQSLQAAVAYIHSLGLHVMFKFQLFPYDGQWSAYINPSDRTTWFANYGKMIDHYAALGQSLGVEQICVGTELLDMAEANVNSTNTQNWISLIGAVRAIYSGKLTYDANWGGPGFTDEKNAIQFWSSLDYISVSAYFNLTGDGSVNSLMQSWGNWNTSDIAPLAQKWGKPIIFGEIGYKAIHDSYANPWMWWEGGNADTAQQANDYQALFQYWNNYSYVQGVDLWYWSSNPNAGGPNDNDYTPQNKPAQNVMKTWFTNASSSGGSGGGGATSTTPTSTASGAIFSAKATIVPATPAPGQSASLSDTVSAANAGAANVNVDMEIYNSAGSQIVQKVLGGQNFTSGGSQTYAFSWTPPTAGNYTLKTGVFSADWHTLYYWNDQTLAFTVSASAPPPQNSSTIQIWWPTNGAGVSGVQPFKAILANAPVDSYNMFWQVDGGQPNIMATNNADYPHKEADVDVTPWTWQASGNYALTFVAKDLSGGILSQSTITLHVIH